MKAAVHYNVDFSDHHVTDMGLASHNVRDEFKDLSVEDRLDYCRRHSVDLGLIVFNVTGDLNTGVMIRSANLMGLRKVFIFGRRRYDNRSTVGATNYTDIIKLGGMDENLNLNPDVFWNSCREHKITPIFLETGYSNINQVNWNDFYESVPGGYLPCIVVGNEGKGLPSSITDSIPNDISACFVTIPQRGVLRSLNVSSAATVAMWHICSSMGWL